MIGIKKKWILRQKWQNMWHWYWAIYIISRWNVDITGLYAAYKTDTDTDTDMYNWIAQG